MSQWWTYSLSDFLLFSPRTYYRLFELYNADIWPAQLLALALGVAILALLRGEAPWRGRAIAAILAAGWLWTAWAFHVERYATINWAAPYMAVGFGIEALLLIWIGLIRGLGICSDHGVVERCGLGLLLFALAVEPAIGPLMGRMWTQIELFGIAPDPTAVGTLGILLATGRVYWQLFIVPITWSVVTGATLWVMDSPDAFVVPLVAFLAVLVVIVRSLSW